YVDNYEESICKFYPIARIVPKFLRRFVVRKGLKRLYKAEQVLGEIRPISDIIEEYHVERIDLLKIDAENYETQVLRGISDSDWDIINQLVVEVHEHIEGGEKLLMRIKELIDSKGFKTLRGEDTRRPSLGVYMLYATK
ncbi:MAG: hypothetical protein GF317_22645, partial [Candidatus Lokiarchaeota archaeon]|nr:hypothetical protein [Candidatus Lokiarchaeota archaeon]MBD3202261.1 hypothetical protein [Candidatus Lokiarchaeota archaeon]